MSSNVVTFRPEIECDNESFALGCVVDNIFVTHFFSGDRNQVYSSRTVFVCHRKKILVQFKTLNETVLAEENSVRWTEDKYELSLNLAQVESIDIDGHRLVIKSTSPALLYRIEDIDNVGQSCDDNNGNDSNKVQNKEQDQTEVESASKAEDLPLDDTVESDFSYEEFMKRLNIQMLDSGIDEFLDFSELCAYTPEDIGSGNSQDIDLSDRFIGLRLRTSKILNSGNEEVFSKTNCLRIALKDASCLKDIVSSIRLVKPSIVIQDKSYKTINAKSDLNDNPIPKDLPFAVKYSLQAITNLSYQLMDTLDILGQTYQELVELIRQLTLIDEIAVEKALNDLRQKIENNCNIKPMKDIEESFNRYKGQPNKKWTNKSVVMVRRCVLTPTRLLLLPALPLQESRFLRTADPEFVIRVLIKDEDMQMLSYTAGKTSLPGDHEIVQEIEDYLDQVIVERLKKGINIGGRTYELVGASTSQLRDHGLVMYARDLKGRTVQDIHKQIGKLEALRNPAKFIARIGQSMSQSMGFVEIDMKNVEMIEDIKGGSHPDTGKPYLFSDGVGKISPQMAEELCNALRIKSVSTFQIRLAGFKGIVVVDPNLEDKKIQLRPESMKKFESDSNELDVLKVSEPRTCYLNRPLVVILNYLGIRNDVFLELLYVRHKQLMTAFNCNCKAIAIMKAYSSIDFNFNGLLKAGIEVLNEPFFVQMIQSIITKASTDLKNKARIQIPYDSARVMYGVMDETGTLEYGQVFVQYSHSDGTKRVLTGEIVVTKYPCMHPGDVRKLMAVDVPALHHIFDSIVFPAKGERPHPDEMAGSDLDGDEYSVIWYKPLIFEEENSRPMDFPCGTPEDIGRSVNDEDLLQFYRRFILGNQVGLVASSHLAWADMHGLVCHKCKILAHKYAVALDYAKTGINAKLRNEDKPKRYPDFMMKETEKPTYRSEKALGHLFRKNCYFHQMIDTFWPQDLKFEINAKLIVPNADKYLTEAKVMFEVYKETVKDLMNRFGIENESALMSVTFSKTNKCLSTRNDSIDTYELITNIVKHFMNDFLKQFEDGVDESERPIKASAWYRVSHEMNGQHSDTYYGFGWIAAKYLIQLLTKDGHEDHVCVEDMQMSSKSNVMIDKKSPVAIFNGIVIKYLENNTDLQIDNAFRKRMEDKVNGIVEECQSGDSKLSVTSLMTVFSRMSDVQDLTTDYEVGITSLMALIKCRRLGINPGLSFLMKSPAPATQSIGDSVSILAITEEVADIFAEEQKKVNNGEDSSLISAIKNWTGVKEIRLKYGFKGHESFVCGVGQPTALRKLNYLISFKGIYRKIRDKTTTPETTDV